MLGELLIVAAAVAGLVEPPPLCSDRPGLTTGTCTVEPGSWTIEASLVEWTEARGGGVKETELSILPSRLRLGLGSATDLHLTFSPYVRMRTTGHEHGRASGIGDASVGIKHRFNEGPASFGLLPFVKLPLAARPLGNRKVEGGVQVPFDFAGGWGWSFTLTPEVDLLADSEGSGRHWRTSLALSAGTNLSDRTSLSLNAVGARERDGGVSREWLAGLSLGHMVSPSLQVDGEVYAGLTRDAPDLRLTTGFTIRPR